jgi:hypothetical protein
LTAYGRSCPIAAIARSGRWVPHGWISPAFPDTFAGSC